MTLENFQIEVIPLKNKLFRFARRLVKNTQEAEDIVQDAFVKLWSNRQKLGEYRSIEAFAMVVIKNICLDQLRARKRKSTVDATEQNEPSENLTPHTELEVSDSFRYVKSIIDDLPDQQKMVVHLRDIEGYEFDEIANMLDMNQNAVRVNLSRARKKIREKMIETHNYEYSKN